MLSLEFSAEDLARTRFALSPLDEVAKSVLTLKDPSRRALHFGWVREARQALDAAGCRYELLSALIPYPALYVPDFFTPVPETEDASLDDLLAVLAATPPDVVRRQLDRVTRPLPAPIGGLHRDPDAGLARLAAEIREYWELAIEPFWPRIRRLLEGEILHRARIMARGGAAALFHDLHPQVAWQDGTLRIAVSSVDSAHRLGSGDGLVLIPSAFVWPGVFASFPPSQATLIYPARGIATLWESGQRPTPEGLVRVFGRSRARVLVELGDPASTTELAARTGMPAATVSRHLTALRSAGLADAQRSGREVIYLRTRIGDALVARR